MNMVSTGGLETAAYCTELSFDEIDAVNGALAPVAGYLVGKAIGYVVVAAAGTATGIAFTKAVEEIAEAID